MLYIFVMKELPLRSEMVRAQVSDAGCVRKLNETSVNLPGRLPPRSAPDRPNVENFSGNKREPTTGIEPVTYGLRNRCSTS
jgi:hypothetical protein